MSSFKEKIQATVLHLLQRIVYPKPSSRVPSGAGPRGTVQPQGDEKDQEPIRGPLQVLRKSSDLQKIYAEMIKLSFERQQRYKDYEDMLLEPTLQGAVEIMVDDACHHSREHSATVWVTADDPMIRKAVEEMFDNIQVEERIFDWAFNMTLYGDFFLKLNGKQGVGIGFLEDDYHPADVQRMDINGVLVGFVTPKTEYINTNNPNPTRDTMEMYDPWEWVHFRIQGGQRRRRVVERLRMNPTQRYQKLEDRLTTRYGVSSVEPARRIFKQLQMVEQSLIIARLHRSQQRYIYKIKTGEASTPKEAAAIMQQMAQTLTQDEGLVLGQEWDFQYQPVGNSMDIFLPVFGDRGDVEIITLGGDINVRGIKDVEMLRKIYHGALKVPAAYLGFESDLPSSLGEGALYRLSIRYARTVKRVQRAVIQGLTRLAQIHLAYKGLSPDPKHFDIEMDIVSTAEEEERKNALGSALTVGRDIATLMTELGLQPPKKAFAKHVFTEVLGLGGAFVDLIEESEEVEAMPEGGMGGDLGGMGGPMPTETIPGGEVEFGEPGDEEVPTPAGEGLLDVPGFDGPESEGVPGFEQKVKRIVHGDLKSIRESARLAAQKAAKTNPDLRSGVPGEENKAVPLLIKLEDKDFAKVFESAIQREHDERVAEEKHREKITKELSRAERDIEVLEAELEEKKSAGDQEPDRVDPAGAERSAEGSGGSKE